MWIFPKYSKAHLLGPILSSAKSPLKAGVVAPAGILCSAFLRDLQKPGIRVGKKY